jgi:anaerobic magnesium-protoporphyrin IX monomethyl ester cyclase
MKNNLDILLVNPHLEFPPDTSGRSGLYRMKEYLLNAGLLSIATYLKSLNISVLLCDLTTADNPKKYFETLVYNYQPKHIGISNQSCHSYLSTKELARISKSIDYNINIIVGGSHASGIPDTLRRECKDVDFVVIGDGELAAADIIRYGHPKINGLQPPDLNLIPSPDYTLYPDYHLFVPYVEESRGCIFKCCYCISPKIHRGIRYWNPKTILSSLRSLQELYGREGFHTFVEANNFATNRQKTSTLAKLLLNVGASWRAESRADTFPVDLLDFLVDAGLRVLDIGLESGSPEMLLRMNKTRNPKSYLENCVRIAEKISANSKCLLKLNIMLFYGETLSTLKETHEYIKLLSGICPLSLGIGPVRMEPGSKMFKENTPKMDLSEFRDSFWGKTHCYPIDLSPEISFESANRICTEIAQEFQTSKTYFEAKRHSQLPYDMTYEQFMEESSLIPEDERQWRT